MKPTDRAVAEPISFMPVRVIVADDHQIVQEGIAGLLEKRGIAVVGRASDGLQALRLAQELNPDVAVLDAEMPVMNGLEAGREIAKVSPAIRSILLTMHAEREYVIGALQAGFKGYILKSKASACLVEAIFEVSRGQTYLCPAITKEVVEAFLSGKELPVDPLSSRERQVLQLIAEGNSTKQVAAALGISIKTVESHRTNLMRKLDIHDTSGLVRYAIRQRLIRP